MENPLKRCVKISLLYVFALATIGIFTGGTYIHIAGNICTALATITLLNILNELTTKKLMIVAVLIHFICIPLIFTGIYRNVVGL